MMTLRPKILIAEDEIAILYVMSIKLKNAGYTVLGATNGTDALELAVREQPALIISDQHMPGMSGLELCGKLNGNKTTRDIPVIMLTSHRFEISQEIIDRAGIVKFMDKPFSPRELLAEVDRLTENLIPALA